MIFFCPEYRTNKFDSFCPRYRQIGAYSFGFQNCVSRFRPLVPTNDLEETKSENIIYATFGAQQFFIHVSRPQRDSLRR